VKAILFLPQGNNSVKGPSTQRDPSVAISLADLDDAYSEAQIRGRAVKHRRELFA